MESISEKDRAEALVYREIPELCRDSGEPVGCGYIVCDPILPHHWLKVLRNKAAPAQWMLSSVGDNFEIIDMTDFGTEKFKNRYMIIGHVNFYKRFCEVLGI